MNGYLESTVLLYLTIISISIISSSCLRPLILCRVEVEVGNLMVRASCSSSLRKHQLSTRANLARVGTGFNEKVGAPPSLLPFRCLDWLARVQVCRWGSMRTPGAPLKLLPSCWVPYCRHTLLVLESALNPS